MNRYFLLITLFFVCGYSEIGARHVFIDPRFVEGWEDASTRWLMVPEYHECVYVGMLDYDHHGLMMKLGIVIFFILTLFLFMSGCKRSGLVC